MQKWQLRSEDEKAIVKQRKLEIQEELRTKMGLLVDVPKLGCGNTNDGNTSRRFFADPELAGAITGIYLCQSHIPFQSDSRSHI